MIPDVTILVAIYNVENYIEKCLKSLIAQTYHNIEILAVSDGSQDESMRIVEDYAKLDSRIKPIHKENGGYGSVLQYGSSHITSEYFLICDPDDWLSPSAVERLLDIAKKSDADIVIGDRIDVYDDGRQIERKVKPQNITQIKAGQVYSNCNMVQSFSAFDSSPHNKLFRTKLIQNINFPKHVSFTDFEMYILALNIAHKCIYIDEAYAYYYIGRPGNTATNLNIKRIDDDLIVWNSTLKQLLNRNQDLNDISILLQEMTWKLLSYYVEYTWVESQDTTHKYINELNKASYEIRKYKKYIKTKNILNADNLLKKIFFTCMLSKLVYKPCIKLYTKIKNKRFFE